MLAFAFELRLMLVNAKLLGESGDLAPDRLAHLQSYKLGPERVMLARSDPKPARSNPPPPCPLVVCDLEPLAAPSSVTSRMRV